MFIIFSTILLPMLSLYGICALHMLVIFWQFSKFSNSVLMIIIVIINYSTMAPKFNASEKKSQASYSESKARNYQA